MGPLQLVYKRQKVVKDAIFSSGSLIVQCTTSLPYSPELGTFGPSSRFLCSEFSTDGSVSPSKQISNHARNAYKTFQHCHGSYLLPLQSFQLGFYRSLHGFGKTEFFVEAADEVASSDAGEISKDAERICNILTSQPSSSITDSLGQFGVKVSPDLVVEVLKKLSNAGVLALSFFQWADKCDGFRHTTECYHHLIEALGKIKQFRLIWDLVYTMRDKALLTKDTFALISRRYARAKMLKEAIETFQKMGMYGLTPDLPDFNRLIDIISKSKNVKVAQKLVYEMKKKRKFSPDLKTYTILMEGWGYSLNLDRLIEVYKEMMDAGLKPDLVNYGILINAYCKSRKLEEALKIFHEMEERNIRPSPHIYCNLINGLGSDKRLDDALKYFRKFNASGFAPELPTYNAVVGAYCWVHKFEDAYKMVEEMRRCGTGPNSRTYDVIISHLIRANKTEEAYRLFQTMGLKDVCKPELNTYTMIVRMLCAEGRVDIALDVWKQMNEKGILPCLHMFLVLIKRLCYESRLEEAHKYLEDMIHQGIRPPGQLYSSVTQALEDGGRKELAVKLREKLNKLRDTSLPG